MVDHISRRTVLIGGLALLVSGCRTRGSSPDELPARPLTPARPISRPLPTGARYEVVAGDTVSSIARRSGISVATIVDANPMLVGSGIKPGMKLMLPGATDATVQSLVATRPRPGQLVDPEDQDDGADVGGGFVLVPRSAWTRDPVARNNNPMGGVTRITVHHTGEHEGLIGLPDVEVLRRVERYHRNEKRWCAIGYHYIVGHDGRVYEGRPAKYQGAHVLSANEHNLGISVVGDFMRKLPTTRQLRALSSFLDAQRTRYRVVRTRVHGHRDLNKSLCPGDALYGWLKTYKRA